MLQLQSSRRSKVRCRKQENSSGNSKSRCENMDEQAKTKVNNSNIRREKQVAEAKKVAEDAARNLRTRDWTGKEEFIA